MAGYDVIQIEQGTAEWREYRRSVLGGSDAPIIMGVSPWRTTFELWQEKTGRKSFESNNFATKRGHELEPKARASYQLLSDTDMPPVVLRHKEFPYLSASLDGFNHDAGRILEIKCPGREDHAMAKMGKIPAKYIFQLEHQLFVSGASEAHYFSFHVGKGGKEDYALVIYESVPERRELLLEGLHSFWKRVQSNEPPTLTEDDWVELRSENAISLSNALAVAVKNRLALKAQLESIEDTIEKSKLELLRMADHPKVRVGSIEVKRSGDRLYFSDKKDK